MAERHLGLLLVCFATLAGGMALAQNRRALDPPIASQPETPRRIHLILKDGSYQLVLRYRVTGGVVRYRSAERDGSEEEIPLALVNMAATEAWERAHDPNAPPGAQAQPQVLSPELAHEEALRAARAPEVARDLRLPEEDSLLVLDAFEGTPELVPLPQQNSNLNRETAHEVIRKEINPQASPHDLLFLKEERADVQLHVADPTFFVRLQGRGEDEAVGGGQFVVDTGGQSGRATPEGGAPASQYVIERVDVRRGERAVSSFLLRQLGSHAQPDLVETTVERMPGGQWERVTPRQPLLFGEYVLVEVLNDRAVNSCVWDFGVHPTAKENDEALRPEPKKPTQLQHRE